MSKRFWCINEPRRRWVVSFEMDHSPKQEFFWSVSFDLLCLPRIFEKLKNSELSGIHSNLVSLKIRRESRVMQVCCLIPVGWGGMASEASGLKERINCPACRLMEYSVKDKSKIFDEDAWDGSDFFMIWPLSSYIFISDRAADWLKGHRNRGFDLVPIEAIGNGPATFRPVPASWFWPPESVRQIAEPLNIA